MGKKLGLGFIGLIIVGAIYYFMAGSQQLTAQMKKQVNTELTSIQKEGFSVENRDIQKEKEHFVLSFDEPQKIASFLSRQGIQLNVHDAELLKGLKLGVDVSYLADAYSAFTLKMYPLALPDMISASTVNEADKKALAQVEQMLKKKTFLMHIAVNKLGNGFKGHMNDIDEVLHGEKDVTLRMTGLEFSGNLQDGKMKSIKQYLNRLILNIPNELDITLLDLVSTYVVTGKTPYDYSTDYRIEKVVIHARSKFKILINDITIHSTSTVKDALASGTMRTNTKSMTMISKGKAYAFNDFTFEIKAANLDVSAFEKLQHVNVNDEAAMNALFQTLISKGVQFEIPTFSVANIEAEGKKMEGFNLSAKVDIDKSLNIAALEVNPLSALSAVDANLEMTLSRDLFRLIAQQPKAMMALMIFQPKNVNGKKVYKLELKDGKFTVNGMAMM